MNTARQILLIVAAIIIAAIAIKILFFVVHLVVSLVTAIVTILIFAALVYIAYQLLRSSLGGAKNDKKGNVA